MTRSFEPADLETIVDIADRAWRPINDMFRRTYGEELYRLLRPDERTAKGDQVRSHCAGHPDWVYVCEREGKIAGFITFWLDEDKKIGVIGNNAKDPDCGFKGVGREMYAEVLAFFKRRGMRYAKVSTGLDEAHYPARRAYEAAGFNIKHQKVDYFKKL